jgi:hypothetical protein
MQNPFHILELQRLYPNRQKFNTYPELLAYLKSQTPETIEQMKNTKLGMLQTAYFPRINVLTILQALKEAHP